jgi:hypothetical protein
MELETGIVSVSQWQIRLSRLVVETAAKRISGVNTQGTALSYAAHLFLNFVIKRAVA